MCTHLSPGLLASASYHWWSLCSPGAKCRVENQNSVTGPAVVKLRQHTPYCLPHIHDCFSTEKKYHSVPLPWEINIPERKGSNRKPSTRVQAHTTDKQKGHSLRTWPVQRHMTEVGLIPPTVSHQQEHTLPNTEPMLGEARSCRGGQSPTPKASPWSSRRVLPSQEPEDQQQKKK